MANHFAIHGKGLAPAVNEISSFAGPLVRRPGASPVRWFQKNRWLAVRQIAPAKGAHFGSFSRIEFIDGASSISNPQLLVQSPHVRVHGAKTQPELVAGLSHGLSLGKQLQHLLLAQRQAHGFWRGFAAAGNLAPTFTKLLDGCGRRTRVGPQVGIQVHVVIYNPTAFHCLVVKNTTCHQKQRQTSGIAWGFFTAIPSGRTPRRPSRSPARPPDSSASNRPRRPNSCRGCSSGIAGASPCGPPANRAEADCPP